MSAGRRTEAKAVAHDAAAAALGAAVDTAASLLLGARLPLVYGLERATVEAQRIAVEIAELSGAAIDPAPPADAVVAAQWIGAVTGTLGELRVKPDLVVYWGIDPDDVHPGFSARYLTRSPEAPERVTIAVDVGAARGPEDANDRFGIEVRDEVEVLWALRARIRHRRVDRQVGESWLDRRLESLVRQLRGSRYVVVLHDADPPRGRRDPMVALALTALAIDAQPTTRMRIIGVQRPGNAAGAAAVLTWQTGFPCAVHFGHGHPRYGPDEFAAERLLARGEADAALLVGAEPVLHLSTAAVATLERIPTIVVGDAGAWTASSTQVHFVTPDFESIGGSVYRMDGVSLRRRVDGASSADVPADAAVLARTAAVLRRRVAERAQ